jgi:hypothetical protein
MENPLDHGIAGTLVSLGDDRFAQLHGSCHIRFAGVVVAYFPAHVASD